MRLVPEHRYNILAFQIAHVNGISLIRLEGQDLQNMGLSRGSALCIQELIEELMKAKGLSKPGK